MHINTHKLVDGKKGRKKDLQSIERAASPIVEGEISDGHLPNNGSGDEQKQCARGVEQGR